MRSEVRRHHRMLAALTVLLLALPGGAPGGATAAAQQRAPRQVTYRPPVAGEVLRAFVPPASDYGPGHRGVDLAARPGDPVGAAAAGVVVHAGPVAGTTWVSIDHADGVRTAYGPLAGVAVGRGAVVTAGRWLGRLAPGGHGHLDDDEGLHFSARRGGAHIDPMALLTTPGRPSLVGPSRTAPQQGSDGGPPAGHGDAGRVASGRMADARVDPDSHEVPARRALPGMPVAVRRGAHRSGGRPPRRRATLSAGPTARWARRYAHHAHHTRPSTGDPGAPRSAWGGSQPRPAQAHASLGSDPG